MNPMLANLLISAALGAFGALALYMLTSGEQNSHRQRQVNEPSRRRRLRALSPSLDRDHEDEYHSYNLRSKERSKNQNQSLQQIEDENEPKCQICFETFKVIKSSGVEISSTICGHLFCEPCLKRHLAHYKHCPICRLSLQANDVHKIYL